MTSIKEAKSPTFRISTHTLTWSVTSIQTRLSTGKADFNSHAHVERDALTAMLMNSLEISTHTLTWSVTRDSITANNVFVNFNSHAHVERDQKFGKLD